jgi:hypothetical protein
MHGMRRALVIAVVAVLAFVAAAPVADAAPSKVKPVSGEVLGAGGFVLDGSCSLIIYSTAGTYRAKHLGRGTYTLRFCVTVPSAFHFSGTLELVTKRGHQLHGIIDSDVPAPLQDIPVTIAGGTGRFQGATGTLLLSLTQFDLSGCDPRVGVCLFWKETGTITGTIIPH